MLASKDGREVRLQAAVIITLATVLFVGVAWRQASGVMDEAPRVEMPGRHDVTLAKAGTWIVHHEYVGQPPSPGYKVPLPDYACELTGQGTKVAVRPSSTSGWYNFGTKTGVEILEFDVATAGAWTITCSLVEGTGGTMVLSQGMVGPVARALVVPLILYLAAVGFAVFLMVGRGQRK